MRPPCFNFALNGLPALLPLNTFLKPVAFSARSSVSPSAAAAACASSAVIGRAAAAAAAAAARTIACATPYRCRQLRRLRLPLGARTHHGDGHRRYRAWV